VVKRVETAQATWVAPDASYTKSLDLRTSTPATGRSAMTIEKKSISRRNLVTGLGAGFAGSMLTTAMPNAEGQVSKNAPASAPFVDPTTKYPKPPYPGQSQPWPGLASKMTPVQIMEKPAIRGRAG
jgi:hypothetical protein